MLAKKTIPEVLSVSFAQLIIFPTPTSAPAITRYCVPISFEALRLTRTRGVPLEGRAFPSPLIRYTQNINIRIDAWIVDDTESWGGREVEAIFLQTVLLGRIFEHPCQLIELSCRGLTQLTANALSAEKEGERERGGNVITNTMAGQPANEISYGQWYSI